MKKINIHYLGVTRRLAWPVECSDTSTMTRSLLDCCQLPYSSFNNDIIFQTIENNNATVDYIVSHLPDDIFVIKNDEIVVYHDINNEVSNELTSLLSPPSIKKLDSATIFNQSIESQSDFTGVQFQKQITKFNRILAHLVNERTVLAWFRMNLAFITLAFKYYKLGIVTMRNYIYISYLLFVCGGLYMIILPWSLSVGFNRFKQCKEMIDYDINRLGSYLHLMGFDYDNFSLGFVILFSFLTICFSSTIIIWKL